MLTPDDPTHIPIILPNDAAILPTAPRQPALMISGVFAMNPRLASLAALARSRTDLLLVDPKTAHFQFEGYMSMPDYRALPYSPGRETLGTLWEPSRFASRNTRDRLIDAVFDVQRQLDADLMVAPYFYVRHARHPWAAVAIDCAAEAIERAAGRAVVPVCVDIDAIIDADHRVALAEAYRTLPATAFWLTVVNFDERRADPKDAAALMDLVDRLQSTGTPTILSHAGRAGLVAIARGAAGYASGTHGLEAHPRQFFREMMGSRPANTYYLEECMVHLPVRVAEAALTLDTTARHAACTCPPCGGDTGSTRMVSRRLALHALLARQREVDAMSAAPPAERAEHVVRQFTEALARASEIAAELDNDRGNRISAGDYHYLEVLREAAGGPAATIPLDEGF